MEFTKALRPRVVSGEITCSVRIWMRPQVKPGGRYQFADGEIQVDSITAIELEDITPELARESGFAGVVDLLKIAKHGRGTNVYLVRFHYVGKGQTSGRVRRTESRAPAARGHGKKGASERARKRIDRMLERLPDANGIAHGAHLSLEVRKKRFGYFLDDHHGDGRVALNCKTSPDVRELLQQNAPAQFHLPKYVGKKGWIGLWLDTAPVDWAAVELAMREAYALVAPKSLLASAALSDSSPGSSSSDRSISDRRRRNRAARTR